MRNWFPQFWYSPIKRHRIAIIGLIVCIASFYGLLSIDIHSHLYIYLTLAFTGFISFLLVFTFYTFGQLKEIGQDVNSFLKTSQRNAVYDYYQLKHKDKDYKGPNWEDEEFSKITDLKERVDAFVKTSIEYQQVDFKRWKKRNVGTNLDTRDETIVRSFLIILASAFSISILAYLGWFNYLSASKLAALTDTSRSFFTIPAALIGTLIASPVIFMVWLFRDKNNRIQIENSRKDTNLKDFQKLSEWASGFHLPEIKQTTSTKNISKTGKDGQENTEETTTSQEDFIAPEGSNSISRRLGAEALQASAIAQLEAFMFGKYGEQFMQPAFLLICAIWESIISQQETRFPDEEEFKKSLEQLHKNPIASAVNKALAGVDGKHLKLFKDNLQGINLVGLSSKFCFPFRLDLSGCNLYSVNLSYAELLWGSFIDADLFNANLYKANLHGMNMQNANLTSANLQEANLSQANLEGAILCFAKLQGTNLSFQNLENTNFKTSEINRYTCFGPFQSNDNRYFEYLLSKDAIWDDDPEWLISKIEDQALLAKIFKDCEERRKYQN